MPYRDAFTYSISLYVCLLLLLYVCVVCVCGMCVCGVCVCVQVKKGGGVSINSMVTLSTMSERMAQLILHEYSIL